MDAAKSLFSQLTQTVGDHLPTGIYNAISTETAASVLGAVSSFGRTVAEQGEALTRYVAATQEQLTSASPAVVARVLGQRVVAGVSLGTLAVAALPSALSLLGMLSQCRAYRRELNQLEAKVIDLNTRSQNTAGLYKEQAVLDNTLREAQQRYKSLAERRSIFAINSANLFSKALVIGVSIALLPQLSLAAVGVTAVTTVITQGLANRYQASVAGDVFKKLQTANSQLQHESVILPQDLERQATTASQEDTESWKTQLQQALTEAQTNEDEAKQEVATLKQREQTLTKTLDEVQSQAERAQQDLAMLKQQEEKLITNLSETQAEVDSAHRAKNHANQERSKLQRQIDYLTRRLSKLQSEADKAQQKNQQYQLDIDAIKSKHALEKEQFNRDKAAQNERERSQVALIRDLQQQIRTLKQDVSRLNKTIGHQTQVITLLEQAADNYDTTGRTFTQAFTQTQMQRRGKQNTSTLGDDYQKQLTSLMGTVSQGTPESSLPRPMHSPGRVASPESSLESSFQPNQRYIGDEINREIKYEARKYEKKMDVQDSEWDSIDPLVWPYDPNLECPHCNKKFRRGQIREYRYHLDDNHAPN